MLASHHRPRTSCGLAAGGLPIRRRLPTCPTTTRHRLFDAAPRLDIMDVMKRLALLLLFCSAVTGAELSDVHTVYLLKMSKGMDQYLANRLTNEHVFQVVTDPKLADAILTDRIGESFESKLEELFPDPKAEPDPEPVKRETPPAKPAKPDKPEKQESSKPSLLDEPVNKMSNPADNSSFGAASGTIFLVWAKSRQVVWSAYDIPKDTSSKQLDRTAFGIVNRIKRDLKKK